MVTDVFVRVWEREFIKRSRHGPLTKPNNGRSSVCVLCVCVCVFITAVPSTRLFASVLLLQYLLQRCSRVFITTVMFALLFITAVPNTKLCAWGEEDRGEHVL